tara:strand:- start:7016 stop:8113 length:1098 start_codon:yes stop_codon:yes gene_type:complete
MPRRTPASLLRFAVLGLTTFTLVTLGVSSSFAQEDREQPVREKTERTFPTAEDMRAGVAQEVARGNLNPEQGEMLMRIHGRLTMGLEQGRLTLPDAMRIMEERAREIYAEGSPRTPTVRLEELKVAIEARLKAIATELETKVEAGELTREAAAAEFEAAEKEMWSRYRQAEMQLTRPTVDLAELKAGIETRIKAMREQLTRMVAAGDISQEDADQRMATAERALWERYRQAEMELAGTNEAKALTRADYDEAARKMKAMVEAGEITREQMQQRLDQMKEMMSRPKAEAGRDYEAAVEKMKAMVEAGEITREQMQQRLERMKAGAEEKKTDPSDDCFKLRQRLGDALRAGEMTREEAAEIWRKEGC